VCVCMKERSEPRSVGENLPFVPGATTSEKETEEHLDSRNE
jgi:hypothetical protein